MKNLFKLSMLGVVAIATTAVAVDAKPLRLDVNSLAVTLTTKQIVFGVKEGVSEVRLEVPDDHYSTPFASITSVVGAFDVEPSTAGSSFNIVSGSLTITIGDGSYTFAVVPSAYGVTRNDEGVYALDKKIVTTGGEFGSDTFNGYNLSDRLGLEGLVYNFNFTFDQFGTGNMDIQIDGGGNPPSVPLPAAVWAGGAMLAGLGVMRKLSRKA